MSDMFILPDEIVNPDPKAVFKLKNDVYRGFVEAVNRNQMILAMDYLSHIIKVLASKIETLNSEQETVQSDVQEQEAPAAPKQTRAPRRSADASVSDTTEA